MQATQPRGLPFSFLACGKTRLLLSGSPPLPPRRPLRPPTSAARPSSGTAAGASSSQIRRRGLLLGLDPRPAGSLPRLPPIRFGPVRIRRGRASLCTAASSTGHGCGGGLLWPSVLQIRGPPGVRRHAPGVSSRRRCMRTRGTRPGARLLGPRGGGPGFLWRQAACRPASVPATTAEMSRFDQMPKKSNDGTEGVETKGLFGNKVLAHCGTGSGGATPWLSCDIKAEIGRGRHVARGFARAEPTHEW
ncbi:hypothetical protein U9M48_041964 [Paspalum notatum var. saurae]|uniref:Uncharacterized protein n=1 Tax=Paspalum notatum var. saurae TaxID=547442 RepID=A0AAQ3URU6_PASNO